MGQHDVQSILDIQTIKNRALHDAGTRETK